jgi:RimJ/RimL family protein N-acetyltransferase
MEWPVLEGSRLILTPTVPEDAESLYRTVDESTFIYSLGAPESVTVNTMAEYVSGRDARLYTMRIRETDEVVGCSSFMDIRPAHRALEIGATWIAQPWQGTFVNPEAKLLMMRHAFETLGCVRVQLKCDARNERSARAIAKLGAVFEGRLRNYGILSDGYIRDTLMFSVTDEEWPQVRAGLESRLVG